MFTEMRRENIAKYWQRGIATVFLRLACACDGANCDINLRKLMTTQYHLIQGLYSFGKCFYSL